MADNRKQDYWEEYIDYTYDQFQIPPWLSYAFH